MLEEVIAARHAKEEQVVTCKHILYALCHLTYLQVVEIPEVVVEELHTCLICQGEDKEGKAMSLDQENLFQTRYHYASCFYDTGVYFTKYPPGQSV